MTWTLDDIVKYGKKGSKAEALVGAFKDKNVALELAKEEGVDRIDRVQYRVIEEDSIDYSAQRQKKTGLDYLAVNTPRAIGAVQEDIRQSVGAIKDQVLRGYILQTKPVNYAGVNNGFFTAHEDAFKANQLLNDKDKLVAKSEEYVGKAVQKLVDKDVNESIIVLLQSIYAKTGKAVEVIQAQAQAKINAFEEMFTRDVATNYALGRYASFDDQGKAQEAYEIAKAVAASN